MLHEYLLYLYYKNPINGLRLQKQSNNNNNNNNIMKNQIEQIVNETIEKIENHYASICNKPIEVNFLRIKVIQSIRVLTKHPTISKQPTIEEIEKYKNDVENYLSIVSSDIDIVKLSNDIIDKKYENVIASTNAKIKEHIEENLLPELDSDKVYNEYKGSNISAVSSVIHELNDAYEKISSYLKK